jgi:hypothetical protein
VKRSGYLQRRVGLAPSRRPRINSRHVHDMATGQHFDSQAEYDRWGSLRMLQMAGEISDLALHPKVVLIPATKTPAGIPDKPEIAWHADYCYTEDGRTVWEDCKPRPEQERETLLFKLWRHFGPGLLRITGKDGKLIKEVMGR